MQLNTAKRASFDEGPLDQYLREISQYPLITREEEVTLAQRIKQRIRNETGLIASQISFQVQPRANSSRAHTACSSRSAITPRNEPSRTTATTPGNARSATSSTCSATSTVAIASKSRC